MAISYQDIVNIVRKETLMAYSDSNTVFNTERNLDFRASYPVYVNDAIQIMCEALSVKADEFGYNDFSPSVLRLLNSSVVLARENSVCVYAEAQSVETYIAVFGEERFREMLKADICEPVYGDLINKTGPHYYIWWD